MPRHSIKVKKNPFLNKMPIAQNRKAKKYTIAEAASGRRSANLLNSFPRIHSSR